MQDRKGVGEGFPATRLGNPDHGATLKECWNGLGLDLRGGGQILLRKRLLKGGKQGEFGKGVHGQRKS